MKSPVWILSLLSVLFFPSSLFSQTGVWVQGLVTGRNTGAPLTNALIKTDSWGTAITNEAGSYRLYLSQGQHQFTITHPGYDTLYTECVLFKDSIINFALAEKSSLMRDVVISASRNQDRAGPVATLLSTRDIEKVPAFMGQHDPLKAIRTLPGSGNAGEGNSGLYIRGGTSGQNLTILNDATIYNPSHLLGFFSVFNSDAISSIKLYKSSIPAEFGGRLSSVIEAGSSKDIADTTEIKGDLSILAANINIITALRPNWSASFSTRKSYMGVTIWPLLNKLNSASKLFGQLGYDFSDLNFSSNAKISKTDLLSFSAFSSGDGFNFGLRSANISNDMNWKNKALSISWNRHFSNSFFINNTISFSGYNFNLDMFQGNYEAGISSRLKDYNIKSTANFISDRHIIKTGLQLTFHKFKPNTPYSRLSGVELDFGYPNLYSADENSVFISDEFAINEKINIYAGGRITYYQHKGPYTDISAEGQETTYKKNQPIKSFSYIEPSLAVRNRLSQNSSLKFSIARNVQPLHLVSVTAINFPTDFWVPSLKNLQPETGIHSSLGYFVDLKNKKYEGYIDLYYKMMKGLVEYTGGVMNLLDNLKIENRLLSGKGRAYGAEFYLKKKSGKLTGWLGYTLAKSDRNFPALSSSSFPSKYDRRHDISLVSSYAVNKSLTLSTYFTYATGNTYTRPVSRFIVAGNIINEYGSFNGSRMPSYHRLDLAASYKIKSNSKFKNELGLSVYNVYNQKNPIFLYFVAKGDLDKNMISVKPESISLLPMLPSLSYRFSFR